MKHDDILRLSLSTIGERGKDYGNHLSSFGRAATIAGTLLGRDVDPFEVGVIMMAVKMSRISKTKKHKDSWVDLIAYTAFSAELVEEFFEEFPSPASHGATE